MITSFTYITKDSSSEPTTSKDYPSSKPTAIMEKKANSKTPEQLLISLLKQLITATFT